MHRSRFALVVGMADMVLQCLLSLLSGRALTYLNSTNKIRNILVTDRYLRTAFVIGTLTALAALPVAAQEITFEKTVLDTQFRSEGVAVGDFNRDGKPDIAAGSVWYAAPDWKMRLFGEKAEQYQPKGYSPSFGNFAADVNGDGWTDLLVNDFPSKPTWWLENPQGKPGPWKRHVCTPVTNNESPLYTDVDGDGTKELVIGYSPDPAAFDGPDRRMGIVRPDPDPYKPWIIRPISEKAAPGTKRYEHGLGVGDVNGDGRNDVLTIKGWWEAPAADDGKTPWTFHPADLGEDAAHMYAHDFDGDGDADVLSSSAHRFGIWWHEQTPDGWTTHTIDESFSQMHAVWLIDVDGDGLLDFVTGKRWFAHGGGDPGADGPALLVWYRLTRKDGRPVWTRNTIDDDSGVGTQFDMADVDGDGLTDIAIANKKGVFLLRQVRK